ncbi:MAG: hypothetical protein OEM00_08785 [Burkholderiaceae bacterium]|nr:hypothetical protein [Burkholderiaceae bacterium]
MNMTNIRLLLFTSLFGTGVVVSQAQQIVVIGHPALTLEADDVQPIYTGEKQLAGSTKLVPVDNASVQDVFLSKYLNIDATKYRSSWTKKSFRDGLTAPAVKGTDSEVVEFVKRTPGGVGYVKAPAPVGVNVLAQGR